MRNEFFPLLTRIYYMLFVGSNPIKTQIVPVFFFRNISALFYILCLVKKTVQNKHFLVFLVGFEPA